MKILSQRDSRWKDILLGYSQTTTIGDYGCTITCLAMLAGLTPDDVNERLKKVNGYADQNLVIWAKVGEAIPWLEFEWRGYQYENNRVLEAIKNYGGCLVEVDWDGKIATPNDRHWVLYVGDQRMWDPWTGADKSTGWYPLLKGYSIIKVKDNPTCNFPENYGEIIKKATRYDDLVAGKDVDIEGQGLKRLEATDYTARLRGELEDARKIIQKKETDLAEQDKQIKTLAKDLADKQAQIVKLTGQNAELHEKLKQIEQTDHDNSTELLKAQQKVQALEERLNTLQERYGKLEQELDEVHDSYDRLAADYAKATEETERLTKAQGTTPPEKTGSGSTGEELEGFWQTLVELIRGVFKRG